MFAIGSEGTVSPEQIVKLLAWMPQAMLGSIESFGPGVYDLSDEERLIVPAQGYAHHRKSDWSQVVVLNPIPPDGSPVAICDRAPRGAFGRTSCLRIQRIISTTGEDN